MEKCYNCNGESESLHQASDDNFYCQTCYDNLYYCYECSSIIDDNNCHYFKDDYYCEDCIDLMSFVCYSCNERTNNDDEYRQNHSSYCQECFYDIFGQCNNCNETYHRDDLYYDDDRDEDYCDYCYTKYKQHNALKAYDYKPSPIFHNRKKRSKNDLFFGVELEYRGIYHTELVDEFGTTKDDSFFAYAKLDASVNFEIVTHPFSLTYLFDDKSNENRFIDYFHELNEHDNIQKTDKGTGFHVHASRKAIKNPIALQLIIYKNISFFEKLAGRLFTESQYIAEEKKISQIYNEFFNDENSVNRRTAINCTRYTLELRIFRSTKDIFRFKRIIQIYHSLIAFTNIHKDNYNLSLENWLTYVKNNKKRYHLLNDYLEREKESLNDIKPKSWLADTEKELQAFEIGFKTFGRKYLAFLDDSRNIEQKIKDFENTLDLSIVENWIIENDTYKSETAFVVEGE